LPERFQLSVEGKFRDNELNRLSSNVPAMTAHCDLLTTSLGLLCGLGELRERKMFGGVYIYCDDLFIALVHDHTLYFKANASTAQEFIQQGLRPFSYLRQGKVATLAYYQAPPEAFDNPAAMKRWAQKALTAAQQDASSKSTRKADAS
jgi:DNA transformation protein and related proteins